MTETHKRTIVRAISWRIVATLVTAAFTGLSGAGIPARCNAGEIELQI